jgi:hypothetical protein
MWISIPDLHRENYMIDMSLCKQSARNLHCCSFSTTFSTSAGSNSKNINSYISWESCYWKCIMRISEAFYMRNLRLWKQSVSISRCCFHTSTISKSAGSSYTNINTKIYEFLLPASPHAKFTQTWVSVNRASLSRTVASKEVHPQTQRLVAMQI